MVKALYKYFIWRLKWKKFRSVTFVCNVIAVCSFYMFASVETIHGIFVTFGISFSIVLAPFIGVFIFDCTRMLLCWLACAVLYIDRDKQYETLRKEKYRSLQKVRNERVVVDIPL